MPKISGYSSQKLQSLLPDGRTASGKEDDSSPAKPPPGTLSPVEGKAVQDEIAHKARTDPVRCDPLLHEGKSSPDTVTAFQARLPSIGVTAQSCSSTPCEEPPPEEISTQLKNHIGLLFSKGTEETQGRPGRKNCRDIELFGHILLAA